VKAFPYNVHPTFDTPQAYDTFIASVHGPADNLEGLEQGLLQPDVDINDQ